MPERRLSPAVPSDAIEAMLRADTARHEGADPLADWDDIRANTGLVAAPDTGRMLQPPSRLR